MKTYNWPMTDARRRAIAAAVEKRCARREQCPLCKHWFSSNGIGRHQGSVTCLRAAREAELCGVTPAAASAR